MMRLLNLTYIVAAMQFFLLQTACGCSHMDQPADTEEPGGTVTGISVSKSEIDFEWAGGKKYITVKGASGWTYDVSADWCSVTKDSDGKMTVSASKNTGKQRDCAITITAGDRTAGIAVHQKSSSEVVAKDVLPENTDYIFEVYKDGGWTRHFVHTAKVSDYVGNPEAGYTQYDMGFVMFTDEFTAPVKVRVTRTEAFSSVQIRPLSYGLKPSSQTSTSVEFTLTSPEQKVSVEFDGDRMTPIFVFPDLPDKDIPSGADVTYYGPGVHDVGLISVKDRSDQTIYIDEGAVVLGRVKAENADNLTIAGRGILCSSQENHGDGRLPQMEFMNCDNLNISGIMLRDTPNWTIKMTGSTGVHIDNIKEIGWIMNSDGMDFICCRNVLVENTFQRNYDDNVTIKAFNAKPEYIASHTAEDGSYTDGTIWMVIGLDRFDVNDIEVRNCVFWADKAHNMVVGPESRGIPFKDIRFHDNIVLENRQDDSVYPGAMAVMIADNGTFENISFEDIIVEDINGGKVFFANFVNPWSFDGLYGQWAKGITFKNISYTGSRASRSIVRGRNATQCIDGVTISNYTVNGARVTSTDCAYLSVGTYVNNLTIE